MTLPTLFSWLDTGFVQPVIYHGRMCHIRRKPDDTTLFRLLRRLGEDVDPKAQWSLA